MSIKISEHLMEVEGEAPTPEEMAKKKAILEHYLVQTVTRIRVIEDELMSSPNFGSAKLNDMKREAQQLGERLQWLQGIMKYRFVIPEMEAQRKEQEEKAKSKIVAPTAAQMEAVK